MGFKRYKCHKEVSAAKILDIVGGLMNVGGNVWEAPLGWMTKNNPEVGGYLVEYKDDYVSYSPAKAFEEGYSEI